MSEYNWVKYRTLHSSGPSAWDYREFPRFGSDESLENELREIKCTLDDELTTYSEHWRGVEVVLEDPPVEFLEQERERTLKHILGLNEYIRRLTEKIIVKSPEYEYLQKYSGVRI